jgi:hypothetical protein
MAASPPAPDSQSAPSPFFVAVTPDDSNDLPVGVCRGLYIGGAGDVTVIDAYGNTVLFKAAPLGFMPIRAARVKAAGTGATNIVALY